MTRFMLVMEPDRKQIAGFAQQDPLHCFPSAPNLSYFRPLREIQIPRDVVDVFDISREFEPDSVRHGAVA